MAGRPIDALLADGASALADVSPTPRLDAEVLLANRLGCARSHFYAHGDREPDAATIEGFEADINRRTRGEPVAHLIGRAEFWSLSLRVGPSVLIPRPDTERLVEVALSLATPRGRVLDLGTGSGAIALAMARERPDIGVTATDADEGALAFARANVSDHGLGERIRCRPSDWFAGLEGETFDMIVTNPPYVGTREPELVAGDVRFEPRSALVAGDDGLAAIERIIADARGHLHPGGWLMSEHGWQQGPAVRARLTEAGYSNIATYQDLGGRDRVTAGQRPG